MYEAKGLSAATARTVAAELTARGALAAQLDSELHIDPDDIASPVQAAAASALSFTSGALLSMLAIWLPPAALRDPVTFAAVLVALASTGAPSARLGGSNVRRAVPAGGRRRGGRPGLHLRRRAHLRHGHRLIDPVLICAWHSSPRVILAVFNRDVIALAR